MKLARSATRAQLRYSSSVTGLERDLSGYFDSSSDDSMSDDDRRTGSLIPVDLSRIEDAILELELRFDSGKAGRYDNAAKLAAISTMTDSSAIKKLVRGWMKFGVPISGGRKVAWRHATWMDGAEALRRNYPPEDAEAQAATDLSGFKQSQRLDPHVHEWLNLREEAGDPVDLEARNKLSSDAFVQTLPGDEDMNELCSHHTGTTHRTSLQKKSVQGNFGISNI